MVGSAFFATCTSDLKCTLVAFGAHISICHRLPHLRNQLGHFHRPDRHSLFVALLREGIGLELL
jgi:hypothetical protein